MRLARTSALAGVVFLLACGSAHAGSALTVNESGDESDPTPTASAILGDPGAQCTLRAAIESATSSSDRPDRIQHPGSGVQMIAVQSPLPAIQTRSSSTATHRPAPCPTPPASRGRSRRRSRSSSTGTLWRGAGLDSARSTGSWSGPRDRQLPGGSHPRRGAHDHSGELLGTNAAGTGARPNGLAFLVCREPSTL